MSADFDVRTSASLLGSLRLLEDQEAWARFMGHYQPMLQTWARRFGLSHDDVEELTSRLLVKLVEVLPRFDYDPQKGSFRGWLKTVTQRELVTFARERNRATANHPAGLMLDRAADVDDLVTGLQDRSESLIRGLHEAIREVQTGATGEDAKSWEAFRRIVLDGHEIGAVAADLGLSYHATAMRVQRVKKKVRDRVLERTGPRD